MNGLFLHSTLSLASSSQSIVSYPTTYSTSSSDDSAVGIGSISGKVIYAFGEATLRGFENLIIRRRLKIINAVFPHKDTYTNKNIDRIYGDLLELSRPGLYQLEIRKQVLNLLLTQIGTRQTRHLMRCLVKWPTSELTIFLAEIMTCMPPDWLPPGTRFKDMHRVLMMTYLTCQTVTGIRREYHPASPLVDFMMQVIQISPSAYQAILGAGFLDVLLCLYACNFNSSISQRRGVDGKSRMLDACSDALTRLCKHPNAFIVISAHPLCKLWPESQTLPFRTTQTEMDRPLAWRQLGSVLVTRRLVSLPAILELPVSEDKSFLSEACVDLVEFATQPSEYGPDIVEDALRCIRRCVELHGFHWAALRKVLKDISPSDIDGVFEHIDDRESSIVQSIPESTLPNDLDHIEPFQINQDASDLDINLPTILLSEMLPTSDQVSVGYEMQKYHVSDEEMGSIYLNRAQVYIVARRAADATCNTGGIIHGHEYETAEPCLDGTREALLLRIKDWTESIEKGARIFWLCGMAGEGKSSIASSVTSWFDKKLLGASFSFSRHDSYRKVTTFLFSTIAIQLANRHDIINHFVFIAMKHHADRRRSLVDYDEFNVLLKQPLEAAARNFTFTTPIVIVLDGIDELWDDEETRKDIRLAAHLLDQLPGFVKFFVTSRPEPGLLALFDSSSSLVERFNLGDIPRATVDHDILTFITMRLRIAAVSHEALQDPDWPGETRRIALTDRSNGIFFWAAAAVDYITSTEGNPEHRISSILRDQSLDPLSAPVILPRMESLYIGALESAYPNSSTADTLHLFHDVVGAISTAKRALSPNELQCLLSFSSQIPFRVEDIDGVTSRLCSVMAMDCRIPGKLHTIHPSFALFLVSSQCPPQFTIHPPKHHAAIGRACLIRMRLSLRRNICRIDDTSVLNSKITDLPTKLTCYLPDDLRYACQFGIDHICSSHRQNGEIYSLVRSFLCEDLRNWLEVLSLLRLLHSASASLIRLWRWIDRGKDDACLSILIPDIIHSIQKYQIQIASAAAISHSFPISLSPRNNGTVALSTIFGDPWRYRSLPAGITSKYAPGSQRVPSNKDYSTYASSVTLLDPMSLVSMDPLDKTSNNIPSVDLHEARLSENIATNCTSHPNELCDHVVTLQMLPRPQDADREVARCETLRKLCASKLDDDQDTLTATPNGLVFDKQVARREALRILCSSA